MINAYLVEQAGEVTIIDAGLPGYYGDIDRELAAMGRAPADVRALVLTHGHSDHVGFAERLRRERAVPVSVHEADAALARGEVPNPSKGFGPVKLGPLLGFLQFSLLHGGLRTPKLQQVATFGDGATLDVPGSPRVILTPGHTPRQRRAARRIAGRPVRRRRVRHLRGDHWRPWPAGRAVHRRRRPGGQIADTPGGDLR